MFFLTWKSSYLIFFCFNFQRISHFYNRFNNKMNAIIINKNSNDNSKMNESLKNKGDSFAGFFGEIPNEQPTNVRCTSPHVYDALQLV